MSRFRNIFNWFISLGKPSWEDSIEVATREARRQWYSKIPRDVLNDGIKCLANEMSKIENFDSLRLSFVDCPSCRNYFFCDDIIRCMRKAFRKHEEVSEG